MKYLKYYLHSVKKSLMRFLPTLVVALLFILLFVVIPLWSEGYTLEDFGFDGSTINPNDYCNLIEVDYTAILHDDPNGSASVEITEYLTFDVHAASKSNLYKELWRELPEETVDGLTVTYDVKSVSQILDDGTVVPYTQTSKMYWEDYDYTASSTRYWHHSDGSGSYPDNDESLLIYIPWTYRDTLTFKIVYTMNNAALKYNDCSELYLSMYSGSTIKKLTSYNAQILIPDEIMPSTYYAYTFGTAKSRIPFTESDSVNPGYYTFSISLDKSDLKFNFHNRYIEFCLLAYGEDKHIFTQYAPNNLYTRQNVLDECIAENEYYETQNDKFNTYKTLLLFASIIIGLLTIKHTIEKLKKIKQKCNLYTPEVDYQYFREIPSDLDPIFASELVFMKDPFDKNKDKEEEYAAILLSLVRKQYIKLEQKDSRFDWDDYNTVISLEPLETIESIQDFVESSEYSPEPIYETINKNTGAILEPLTTSERLYYELLERHSRKRVNPITLKQLQSLIDNDYSYTNSFIKDMEKKPAIECGVEQGYFSKTNYNEEKNNLCSLAKRSLGWGLVWLIVANGISYFTPLALGFGAYTILGIVCLWKYFYLTIKSSDCILFTQFGVNEQAKWYGLYNFLNSNTLINEKTVDDLVLWEKYLIYATAFGISEKVIKAIKINAVELNIDNSLILNNHCYIHSSSFHHTSRGFGRSIHTHSRGVNHFSGGGGYSGHGYGGGGRGGGGGGGGH